MIPREETQRKLDLMAEGALRHTPEQTYTVADRFEECASLVPDDVFLIWGDKNITYGEANRAANWYAHVALSLGLIRGDVVSLMMHNLPEFIYIWFGLSKIGCITALINPHVVGDALSHAVTTSTKSKWLFVSDECSEQIRQLGPNARIPPTIVISDGAMRPLHKGASQPEGVVATQTHDNPDAALRNGCIAENVFCLVFTSGTTGLPKAAKVTHMRWLGVGDAWVNLLGLSKADVFYCVLPLYHVAAGMSLLSQVLACRGRMVLRHRFSASQFWVDVRKYGVTVTQYSGEMCRYLLNQAPRVLDKQHNLRIMAGAGLNSDIWVRFQERFAVPQIIEGYGGTEINCNLANLRQ